MAFYERWIVTELFADGSNRTAAYCSHREAVIDTEQARHTGGKADYWNIEDGPVPPESNTRMKMWEAK